MNEQQILDAVNDLAEEAGVTAAQFITSLTEARGRQRESSEGNLPENIRLQLSSARDLRRKNRDEQRKSASVEKMRADIAAFRRYFPDVSAEQIPDSVWSEVSSGISLPYAYALWLKTQESDLSRAETVNAQNEDSSIPSGDAVSNGTLSKEEVENMSPQDVKSNYRRILDSIRNWRL